MGRDGPPGRPSEERRGPAVPPYRGAMMSPTSTARWRRSSVSCSKATTGDILVFLPTRARHPRGCAICSRAGKSLAAVRGGPVVRPVDQRRAAARLRADPAAEIVLATNIAETSLTIPGIRFVVDTGLARVSAATSPQSAHAPPAGRAGVAKSSADQRKGRCGRVSRRRVHPAILGTGLQRPPPFHAARDPAQRTSPMSSCA